MKKVQEKKIRYTKRYGTDPRRISPQIYRNGFTNLNNLEYNYISVSDTEQKFQLFIILDEDESKLLCKIIMNFSDEYIGEDLFAHFLKGLVEDSEKAAKKIKAKTSKKKYM